MRLSDFSRRLVAAAALLAGCASGLAGNWESLGPAPLVTPAYTGRISALACSPTNPNLYFAGGADGGVWRTTDGGATWLPLTDHMPCSAIGALAIDPTNENVIYAGTGEANFANHSRYGVGIYKSTNGGDSWTQLAESTFAGRSFSRIVIDPTNPQRIFAAVTRAGGFPELAAAKGHPQATGPVGLFRSLDGGSSWTHLSPALPAFSATDAALDPANPAIVYAAIGHIFGNAANGIYKSIDGGDSWTRLGGGLPAGSVGRISIVAVPGVRTRLYALIARAASASGGNASTLGAFRSDNAGETWATLTTGSIQATYGWYLCVVHSDPAFPDVVFMGGLSMVRSTNAGASFTTVTPPHVDMHAAAWDAAGRLLVADDGGVHRSTDRGGTWTALNTTLSVVQFYPGFSIHPTNAEGYLAGAQDNGTNYRSSPIQTWTSVLGGDGGWTQIDQATPLRMFAEFQQAGNIYLSTNGGASFTFSGTGIATSDRTCFEPPFLIDRADARRMFYATQRIYRSTNGGVGWSAISGDLTGGGQAAIRALALAPSDSNTLYLATNDGRFSRSVNGGVNWEVRQSNLPLWPRITNEIFVDPLDAQSVYLAGWQFGADRVRRSSDGGATWTTLDGDLPDIPVNSVLSDRRWPRAALYAGTDAGLFRSLDDGRTWVRYRNGLPFASITDMRLDAARNRLVLTTMGRGAWRYAVAAVGDMNGDGAVDNGDIDAFTLALTDEPAYRGAFPAIDPDVAGDLDLDGELTNGDVDGFVDLLLGF